VTVAVDADAWTGCLVKVFAVVCSVNYCPVLFMCGVILYENNCIRDGDGKNLWLIHSDFKFIVCVCFLIECHEIISDGWCSWHSCLWQWKLEEL